MFTLTEESLTTTALCEGELVFRSPPLISLLFLTSALRFLFNFFKTRVWHQKLVWGQKQIRSYTVRLVAANAGHLKEHRSKFFSLRTFTLKVFNFSCISVNNCLCISQLSQMREASMIFKTYIKVSVALNYPSSVLLSVHWTVDWTSCREGQPRWQSGFKAATSSSSQRISSWSDVFMKTCKSMTHPLTFPISQKLRFLLSYASSASQVMGNASS